MTSYISLAPTGKRGGNTNMSASPESCLMKPKLPLRLMAAMVPVALPLMAAAWLMSTPCAAATPDNSCISEAASNPCMPSRRLSSAVFSSVASLDTPWSAASPQTGAEAESKVDTLSALGLPVFGSMMMSYDTREPTGGNGGRTNMSGPSESCLMKPKLPLIFAMVPVHEPPPAPAPACCCTCPAAPAGEGLNSAYCPACVCTKLGSTAMFAIPDALAQGSTLSARVRPVLLSVTIVNCTWVPIGGSCRPNALQACGMQNMSPMVGSSHLMKPQFAPTLHTFPV
mmetsp:Transcript_69930/g.176192  ORF Transcript_69930/g.176192 Transcript_69930/m.176192 type:complete len:284 (+) Transcript_69930:497-1348(+)